MPRTIEIIDPYEERARQRKRRLVLVAFFVGLTILAYPEVQKYASKWHALGSARRLASDLSMLKTKAILSQTPIEVEFKFPNLMEISEVVNCGQSGTRKKLWDANLSFEGIQFVPEDWIRQNIDTKEPIYMRYCYDPIKGFVPPVSGPTQGSVYVAHLSDIASNRSDHVVQIYVDGEVGELDFE